MIARLWRQYPLKLMLDLLIKLSKSKAHWWIVDATGETIYSNHSAAPNEGKRWEIVVGEHYGTLISSEKSDVLLSEIIQQLLTLLIQVELQRQADVHWRENVQDLLNLHARYRNLLGFLGKRQEISALVLKESLKLSEARAVLLYVRTNTGLYILDAHTGQSPYGDSPPFRVPDGLMRQVVQHREVQWVNDLMLNPHASEREQQARNALVLPVFASGEVWGVLGIFDQDRDYTAGQVQQLQILTEYAAIAYHNAAAIQALLHDQSSLKRGMDTEWDEVFEHSDLDWQEVNEPSNPSSTTTSYRIDNR